MHCLIFVTLLLCFSTEIKGRPQNDNEGQFQEDEGQRPIDTDRLDGFLKNLHGQIPDDVSDPRGTMWQSFKNSKSFLKHNYFFPS